jgi:hypothetical protein
MLSKESANDMYTRLNILVEDLNALVLTQMSPSDVARRILSVLPVEKYGHIVTMLHQSDLSTAIPTQVLGKINAHEMYMHITPEEGSSSSKKKDLAFKSSHDKKRKKSQAMIVHESSSESDIDDASLALMVSKVKGIDKIAISNDHSLSNVLYVASLSFNLLSVGQFCDLGYQCLFTPNEVVVSKIEDKQMIFKGFRYKFDDMLVHQNFTWVALA